MLTAGEIWPLHGLVLRTPDLELRVLREADLPALARLLPPDLEMDPSAIAYPGMPDEARRRANLFQIYWRAMGTWSPDDWTAPFVVLHEGEAIGAQALEGPRFRAKRTVDSWSWLAADARGRGYGKQMRRAILTLAFGRLEAWAAVSSAVLSNAASLGVSRSLGYRDVGREPLGHGDETLQLLRLERADWELSGLADGIEVEGMGAALPLFGLVPDADPRFGRPSGDR